MQMYANYKDGCADKNKHIGINLARASCKYKFALDLIVSMKFKLKFKLNKAY